MLIVFHSEYILATITLRQRAHRLTEDRIELQFHIDWWHFCILSEYFYDGW
jgi:hypothetical protein